MKRILQFAGVLAIAACFVGVALGAGEACDGGYPECPDESGPNGQGSSGYGCNYPNVWQFGDEIPLDFYICNGKDSHCEATGANCNVIVKYGGTGRILTCEPAGWQVTCATEITSAVPLNIKCENGEKCDPYGATDTIPELIPPSGHGLLNLDPLIVPGT